MISYIIYIIMIGGLLYILLLIGDVSEQGFQFENGRAGAVERLTIF
jgi:hypothetical protein